MSHWDDQENVERALAQAMRGNRVTEAFWENYRRAERAMVDNNRRRRWWTLMSLPIGLVVFLAAWYLSQAGWHETTTGFVVGIFGAVGAGRPLTRAMSFRSGYLERKKRDLLDLELSGADPSVVIEFRHRSLIHDMDVLMGTETPI